MTEITHGYAGMGKLYAEARKGTPEFARYMVQNSGLEQLANAGHGKPIRIVEFGVGSGQQTAFVEQELQRSGIANYLLLAIDKSFNPNPEGEPDQLNVLKDRITKTGEISSRVIPIHYDIDGRPLPILDRSVDLSYMAFVHHHLEHKARVMQEIARITRQGARHFMFGAALEDLAEHPLNEFFPSKYRFDTRRYPTKEELKALFEQSGFAYQGFHPIMRDDEKPIDRKFLRTVEDKPINSVLVMIENEASEEFKQGVERIKREVERAEITGQYRTFAIFRTIHRGIKQ